MAEAKTIKRRGFLKALPLAGIAAATPALATAAPTGPANYDEALAYLKEQADDMIELISGLPEWESNACTNAFFRLNDYARAMCVLPARSLDMIAAKRELAEAQIHRDPHTIQMPVTLRRALQDSAAIDEKFLTGARA